MKILLCNNDNDNENLLLTVARQWCIADSVPGTLYTKDFSSIGAHLGQGETSTTQRGEGAALAVNDTAATPPLGPLYDVIHKTGST